jgi:hypothetical protein
MRTSGQKQLQIQATCLQTRSTRVVEVYLLEGEWVVLLPRTFRYTQAIQL